MSQIFIIEHKLPQFTEFGILLDNWNYPIDNDKENQKLHNMYHSLVSNYMGSFCRKPVQEVYDHH